MSTLDEVRPQADTGSDLAGQVRLTVVRLYRRLRAEHGPGALTGVQSSALDTLSRHGPLTPRELAACERIQPPTMTRLIASLEKAGLISRESHPGDRRQHLLRLTPLGTKVFAEAAYTTTHWFDLRLAELAPEERATLAAAVEVINKVAAG